jgi:hypothetical protein
MSGVAELSKGEYTYCVWEIKKIHIVPALLSIIYMRKAREFLILSCYKDMYNLETNLPKGMSLAAPCAAPWFGCGAIVDANNAWPLGLLCSSNSKLKYAR